MQNALTIPTASQIQSLIPKQSNKGPGLNTWEMLVNRLRISEPDISAASLIGAAATVAVETGYLFQPIRELGTPEYFRKMYGNRPDFIVDKLGRWVWAGRGLIQLSGRYNYSQAGDAIGLPLLEKPDIALWIGPACAIFAFYWKKHDLTKLCNIAAASRAEHDWMAVRRAVNGGLTGWHEFREIIHTFGAID